MSLSYFKNTSFLGYYSGGSDYFTYEGDCGGFDLKLEEAANCGVNCSRHLFEAVGQYSTALFASRAVDLIDDASFADDDDGGGGGMFLYLPFQAVHVPDQVPEHYMEPYNFSEEPTGTNARNVFAGMLSALDEAVGNITAALDRNGLLDETLIWFQSDNGAATPACGGWSGAQNWPLRGGKCTAWDGGLRGVAFVSGAGIDPERRGAIEPSLMHTVDVLPTLLDALSPSSSSSSSLSLDLDGISQWDVIAHGDCGDDDDDDAYSVRDTVLLEADPLASPFSNRPPEFVCDGDQHATPYYAIRQRQWKLIIGDPGDDSGNALKGIGNGWWCTGPPCPSDHNNSESLGPVDGFPVDTVQLFDVVADPGETTDRSADFPGIVANLTALIEAYNASAVDSSGTCLPADPKQDPALHNGTCTPWASPETPPLSSD